MLPSYADLRWITSTSGCGVDLQELAAGKHLGCDPYGRGGGLGYPPMAIEFARLLHVNASHTGLIGFGAAFGLLAITIWLCQRFIASSLLRMVACSLLILGFPFQLALERSNIDAVIFLLLAGLSALLASHRLIFAPVQALIAWLAVAIKLYPVAGILGWLLIAKKQRQGNIFTLVSVAIGAMAGLVSVWPWFQQSGSSAAQPLSALQPVSGLQQAAGLQQPLGLISHGLRFTLVYQWPDNAETGTWGDSLIHLHSLWITMPIFTLALYFGIRQRTGASFINMCNQLGNEFAGRFAAIFVPLSACVWLGCYLLSSSYDYRMIFAYPTMIAIIGLPSFLKTESNQSILNTLFITGVDAAIFAPILLIQGSGLISSSISVALVYFCDLVLMPLVAGVIASMLIVSPPRLFAIR